MAMPNANFAQKGGDKASWLTWHRRLGHLHHRGMKYLQNDPAVAMNIIGAVHPITMEKCEDCIMGKMTRFPFKTGSTKTSRPGELIFSDLEGPFPVPSIKTKSLYYVS